MVAPAASCDRHGLPTDHVRSEEYRLGTDAALRMPIRQPIARVLLWMVEATRGRAPGQTARQRQTTIARDGPSPQDKEMAAFRGACRSRVLKSDRTGLTAALRYRFTGPVRPVTGGNRLNSNPNSNKFKNSRATGSDRFTGRFYRFTGRFDRFEIQKLPCNRFTGRFDRFDRWAFMGRPIFFFSFWI